MHKRAQMRINVFGFITWQGWVTGLGGGGRNENESRLAEM